MDKRIYINIAWLTGFISCCRGAIVVVIGCRGNHMEFDSQNKDISIFSHLDNASLTKKFFKKNLVRRSRHFNFWCSWLTRESSYELIKKGQSVGRSASVFLFKCDQSNKRLLYISATKFNVVWFIGNVLCDCIYRWTLYNAADHVPFIMNFLFSGLKSWANSTRVWRMSLDRHFK